MLHLPHSKMHFHVFFSVELSHNSLSTEGLKNVSKKPLKKNETCAMSRSFYWKSWNFCDNVFRTVGL